MTGESMSVTVSELSATNSGIHLLMAPVQAWLLDDVPLAMAEEVATFVTEKRRNEHLSGRWLLGVALERWGVTDLSSIEVQRTEHRAPYLAHIQGVWKRTPLPSVSIAHSSDCVVVACAPPDWAVGIDMEPEGRTLAPNAYDMMAKGEELRSLREHPDAAMRLWTGKEAVQKSLGLGMHLNPRDIEIPIGQTKSNISIGKSNIQLEYWKEKGFHFSLALTPATPSEPTPEERLLEETRVAMQADPNWGVGCKTQRNGA
ncbi:MAG: 4'-phosphopantetheinyl transferase superfamily protein [Candidatus Poseidonia sp.]|nr:4'-phosphopantetheinyl transferase superfamily protein [Poseidonia sp.]